MSAFSRAIDVLRSGVAARVFPGASVEVGTAASVAWRDQVGSLAYEPDAPRVSTDTVFDLASLTKVVVTATVAMRLAENGVLALDAPVRDYEAKWQGDDRTAVCVRDLLEHASGLPAWEPLWRAHTDRDGILAAIAATPLECAPRSRSIYSDLGFILLGHLLETIDARTLDRQFDEIAVGWMGGGAAGIPLVFNPPASWRPRIAPTRFNEWRDRLLAGEVDDDNAWAMKGVAGHSGLFGTAAAVGVFAQGILRVLSGGREAERRFVTRETVRLFLSPSTVPRSSRALGWDMMRTTSSCGSKMSAAAVGHTGFTGTSLWIDPEQDFYAVLLTNRVHPEAGPNEPMQAVRRAFHDALLEGRAA